jgi:hypothetical protein
MRIFLIVFLFLTPLLAFSQQNFEGGVFLGTSNYQGDLSENAIHLEESRLAYGLFVRVHKHKNFKAKANIFIGSISGTDLNADKGLASRGWSFKSNLIEAGLQAEYHPFGKKRYSISGIFQRQFSPYLAAGVAFAQASADLNIPDKDKSLFPESDDINNFIGVPIIIGIRLDLLEDFSFGLEMGWRAIFSDYLDNVSKNGNPKKDDWYSVAGFSLSYHFRSSSRFNSAKSGF